MVNFKFISKGLKCIGQDVENPEFDKIMFCGFPTGEKIKFEDVRKFILINPIKIFW